MGQLLLQKDVTTLQKMISVDTNFSLSQNQRFNENFKNEEWYLYHCVHEGKPLWDYRWYSTEEHLAYITSSQSLTSCSLPPSLLSQNKR